MLHFLDPLFLIKTLGSLGVIAIIFAETGLFFGFFLPGDSLLFSAGLLAAEGHLNIWLLVVGSAIAAIVGDSVGYWFGAKTGPKIFTREDSRFFKRRYLEETKKFYEKHGKMTVIMARFVPIVRTFAPIFAGVGKMPYREFLVYNISGGLLWTVGLIVLGFSLGRTIPNIDAYIVPIIILIILTSFAPSAIHFFKRARKKSAAPSPESEQRDVV